MGGCVVYFGAWRVNGSLSVSRAIGDAEHKPYVWGQPDTATFDLDGTEDFVVLACDGLWDVLSQERVIEIVMSHIRDTGSRDAVAKALVDEAKVSGSNDNITVVLVFLDGERKPERKPSPPSALPLEPQSKASPKLRSSAQGQGSKGSSSSSDSPSSNGKKPTARTVNNGRGRGNGKAAGESSSANSKPNVPGIKKS